MTTKSYDWSALHADSRFKKLQRKKSVFLWRLFLFGVVYYFMLPIGAAWFSDIFKVTVWGPINVGLLFALSQFIVAWGIAFWYSQKAGEFDELAEAILRDAPKFEVKS